jgi:hypothetical protein
MSDMLLALLEHQVLCVLTLVANGNLVSLSTADLSSFSVSRVAPAMILDYRNLTIAFIYDRVFQFASITAMGDVSIHFHARVHKRCFSNGAFIENEGDIPVLAVLSDNVNGAKILSTHLVDASRKVMYPGPWQLDSVDSSSTWCFAPPLPVNHQRRDMC